MKAYPFILLVPFSFLLSFTSSYASDMRAQKTEQAGYVCDFRNYNFIENKNVLLNIDRSENPQQLFFIQIGFLTKSPLITYPQVQRVHQPAPVGLRNWMKIIGVQWR